MAHRYKPTTPSRRSMMGYDFSNLSAVKPLKSLMVGLRKKAGRNNQGRITTRHQGGGHKQSYRLVDFKQQKLDVPANVFSIEYDPNRTVRIALLHYLDGEKRYILAPTGMKVGDRVVTSERAPLEPGNRMMLKNIPQGTEVHNLEFHPGKGGQIVKSAGSAATVLAHEGNQVQVVLPSSEVRKFSAFTMASVGRLSNIEHSSVTIGSAGRARHMGRRPAVRGSAMNPVDHPHGGGEGRQPIGLRYPKTPWGKHALGVKTRKRKKKSGVFIIRRRKK